MPINYDIEKDGLYRKGEAKGFEKGITKGKAESDRNAIIGMYRLDIDSEKIAKALKLELGYIKRIIDNIEKD